jgi:hypothetical protein
MMEKEFVPENLVEKLKEVGYNGPIIINYILLGEYKPKVDIIQRITFSQAFRWFREKYNLYPSINIYNDKWLCVIKSTISNETEISGYIVDTINNGHPTFDTYPEAEFECLKKLIEIIENQK